MDAEAAEGDDERQRGSDTSSFSNGGGGNGMWKDQQGTKGDGNTAAGRTTEEAQQDQEKVAECDGQSQSATSYLDQNDNTCKEKEAEINPVVTPADMELLRHLVVADLASAVKTMAEFIGRPRN